MMADTPGEVGQVSGQVTVVRRKFHAATPTSRVHSIVGTRLTYVKYG
jgi:hypothetical protein